MSAADAGQATPPGGGGTTHAERRALLATCVAAAARGTEQVRAGDARRAGLVWEAKGRFDFVSEVDRSSETAIAETIRERHADATLLAEEGSPDAQSTRGLVFVVDPLDGTTNFLHGVPWYAVSVAALVDGALVAGAVINAATGELFSATLEGGARRGGQAIRVSTVAEPSRALVASGFPFTREDEIQRYVRMLPAVMRATSGIRRAGAAALDLADVACGRFEAFWELRLSPWDIAAGLLLVREAGGIVTTLEGAPCPVAETSVVAGNPAMHAWLLDTLDSHGS
ncbi:MAG: inositol monophosphatase [Gemmatimonadetes bacterium]|jgi:myo-inositol-1(or 4)-monophosphatase|nr:inositol monophosphatase [Gemmatimonadota bacterium]